VTIHQFLNGVLYTGAVAGALAAIGLILNICVVRPVRGFLRKEIVSSLVDIKESVDRSTIATAALDHKVELHIANGTHAHTHTHTSVGDSHA
jgi:hypothetical protein